MSRGVSETVKTTQGLDAQVTLWDDGSVDVAIGSNVREPHPLVAVSFSPREARQLREWLAVDVGRLLRER